jgi:hypothetical protein
MSSSGGPRGPVPKRSSERRRRNAESQVETAPPVVDEVLIPEPSESWHPTATAWYVSLAESGQSQFFEPSDWHAAHYVAEAMSRNLAQGFRMSSQMFAAVWSAMGDLLSTEASRRRVRLEIERGGEPPVPAGVSALADYRKRAAGGQ